MESKWGPKIFTPLSPSIEAAIGLKPKKKDFRPPNTGKDRYTLNFVIFT
jgi:hypothetical protein